jgi:hypothetical protein
VPKFFGYWLFSFPNIDRKNSGKSSQAKSEPSRGAVDQCKRLTYSVYGRAAKATDYIYIYIYIFFRIYNSKASFSQTVEN